MEKKECWKSLLECDGFPLFPNIIMGGDLNLNLSCNDKKGGSTIRDPNREWVEYVIQNWVWFGFMKEQNEPHKFSRDSQIQ